MVYNKLYSIANNIIHYAIYIREYNIANTINIYILVHIIYHYADNSFEHRVPNNAKA